MIFKIMNRRMCCSATRTTHLSLNFVKPINNCGLQRPGKHELSLAHSCVCCHKLQLFSPVLFELNSSHLYRKICEQVADVLVETHSDNFLLRKVAYLFEGAWAHETQTEDVLYVMPCQAHRVKWFVFKCDISCFVVVGFKKVRMYWIFSFLRNMIVDFNAKMCSQYFQPHKEI